MRRNFHDLLRFKPFKKILPGYFIVFKISYFFPICKYKFLCIRVNIVSIGQDQDIFFDSVNEALLAHFNRPLHTKDSIRQHLGTRSLLFPLVPVILRVQRPCTQDRDFVLARHLCKPSMFCHSNNKQQEHEYLKPGKLFCPSF